MLHDRVLNINVTHRQRSSPGKQPNLAVIAWLAGWCLVAATVATVAGSQPDSEQTVTMRVVISVWLASLVAAAVQAQNYQCDPSPAGLSDNCIGCICEASTNCNKTAQCISGVSGN